MNDDFWIFPISNVRLTRLQNKRRRMLNDKIVELVFIIITPSNFTEAGAHSDGRYYFFLCLANLVPISPFYNEAEVSRILSSVCVN